MTVAFNQRGYVGSSMSDALMDHAERYAACRSIDWHASADGEE